MNTAFKQLSNDSFLQLWPLTDTKAGIFKPDCPISQFKVTQPGGGVRGGNQEKVENHSRASEIKTGKLESTHGERFRDPGTDNRRKGKLVSMRRERTHRWNTLGSHTDRKSRTAPDFKIKEDVMRTRTKPWTGPTLHWSWLFRGWKIKWILIKELKHEFTNTKLPFYSTFLNSILCCRLWASIKLPTPQAAGVWRSRLSLSKRCVPLIYLYFLFILIPLI